MRDRWRFVGGRQVIAGRILAAQSLELTEAPVIVLPHLSKEQHRAYWIADNKLTELGEWDEVLLSAELQALLAQDFDLSVIGFSDGEIDKLLAAITDANGVGTGGTVPPVVTPDPPRNPASRTGDLWVLGDRAAERRQHERRRRMAPE